MTNTPGRSSAVALGISDDRSLAHQDCDDPGAAHARHESVLGQPPRLVPLTPEDVASLPGASQIASKVFETISLGETPFLDDYTAIFMRHPQLYLKHTELGLELFRGALRPRHRELVILRVGWLCQAPFEWGEHVAIGRQ